jgi:serine/threonine protein kinase
MSEPEPETESTDADDLAHCALLDEYWQSVQQDTNVEPARWLRDRHLAGRATIDEFEVMNLLHEMRRASLEPANARLGIVSVTAAPDHYGIGEATSWHRPARPTSVPSWIGRYQVLEAIDEGGQGQLFRVLHPELKCDFALKIIPAAAVADPAERKRLVEEARKLAGCEHPGLVRVIDLDFHESRPFVVMEYVRGPNLEHHCELTPPSARQSAKLVSELAEAAAHIHEQGLVHQDIKPKNVLVDGKGRARLIDFGLARASHAWTDDSDQSFGGTAGYMSPEQARGKRNQIGPATDIFGLGGVLYFLLTGRPVYEGPSRSTVLEQASKAEQIPPRSINPRIPRRLERICLKALSADPEHRFGSAHELAGALRGYLRRPRVVAAGASILGLAALAFAAVQMRPDRSELAHGRSRAGFGSGSPSTPASRPRILSLKVEHFRAGKDFKAFGPIGASIEPIRFDDDLRVRASLSAPGYCYLLALNPDGKVQRCVPAAATEPPTQSEEIVYPTGEEYFPLTDGVGWQAFLLLVSCDPLPAFDMWAGRTIIRWEPAHDESVCVWRFDGHAIEPVTRPDRSQPRKRAGAPRNFKKTCDSIRKLPLIDAVAAIAFQVSPKPATEEK